MVHMLACRGYSEGNIQRLDTLFFILLWWNEKCDAQVLKRYLDRKKDWGVGGWYY